MRNPEAGPLPNCKLELFSSGILPRLHHLDDAQPILMHDVPRDTTNPHLPGRETEASILHPGADPVVNGVRPG